MGKTRCVGIETLLTLLVATGILLSGAALCLVALGIVRVVALFSGDGARVPNRGRHAIDAALPGAAVRDGIRRVLEGIRAASLFLLAAIYTGVRNSIAAGHRTSLRADAFIMGWWATTAMPFLRETTSATYDLATFYRSRPEEMPYLAGTSLVPTYDPMEDTREAA